MTVIDPDTKKERKAENIGEFVDLRRDDLQDGFSGLRENFSMIFDEWSEGSLKGWHGQGYTGDFNREGKWKMARAYYWLQKEGKVKTKLVKQYDVFRNGKRHYTTSFAFNERAIIKYFKDNPHMLPDKVPLYDYRTNDKSKISN